MFKISQPSLLYFLSAKWYKGQGGDNAKIATGLKRGASDLIVLFPNRVVFCEVKTPTGVQSEAQKDFQEQVENLGFEYILVRSLLDFQIKI